MNGKIVQSAVNADASILLTSASSQSATTSQIEQVIIQQEGLAAACYVPNGGVGVGANSGITCGPGFDTNQWTYAQAQAAGISTNVLNELAPVLRGGVDNPNGTLVGSAAQSFLAQNSSAFPALSTASAEALGLAILPQYINWTTQTFSDYNSWNNDTQALVVWLHYNGALSNGSLDTLSNRGGTSTTKLG